MELLGAILGNPDTALNVLTQYVTLTYFCAKAATPEIEQVKGVGPAGAARIKAALELGRRLITDALDERPQIRAPATWPIC